MTGVFLLGVALGMAVMLVLWGFINDYLSRKE